MCQCGSGSTRDSVMALRPRQSQQMRHDPSGFRVNTRAAVIDAA